MLVLNEPNHTDGHESDASHEVARAGMRGVYVPADPITEASLCDWIASALVGQSIQFHVGLLMVDRAMGGGLTLRERNRLHAVARRAWIACELGLVHLFSQKISEGRYRYFAMRSSTHLMPPEIRSRLKTATPTNHAN